MADKNSYGIETETAELAIINQHMQSIGNYNNSGNAGNSHSSAVHQESPRAVHRGAGAILTSWLVYQGWKFPNFVSSESDDRIFFDLEVTVKLAHESAVPQLWDVLADFPVQLVMARPGLLRSVLDIVGSVFSSADLDANPLAMTPITAISWLESLLKKAYHAFAVQFDGSYCSSVPARINSTEEENPAAALATKLTEALYEMRHPVVPLRPGVLQTSNYSFDKNNEDEQLQKIIEDQKLNSLRGGIDICPSPSLPGLAFACCAAVLPLLQAKNPVLTKAVQSLLTIALPFVIEPTMSAAETLTTLDHSRLQHLLHRVDQLLEFFDMDKYDFSSYISCVVVDNTHSDGEDTDHFIEACHQIILVDIILKLWSTIPVSCIKPLKMESADGCALLLSVGQSSRDLMYKLLSMECMESVLPPYLHSVTNLLQVLDPDSLKSINYAKTLNRSIKLFANDVSFPVDVNRTQLLSYFVASVGEACRVFDLDEVTVSLYGENVDRLIESVVVLTVVALNCEAGSDYEDSNYLKEDWNTIKLFGVLIKLLSHHKKSVRLSLVWNILQVVGFTFGNKSEAFPVGLFGQKIFERLDLDLENCCEPFLRFICKPVFLYSLLLFCCLNDYEQKLTDDKDNESDESIQNLSVNLIEMLYSYLIAEDFEEGNWLPLLIPMKLLMWNTSSGASDRPAINKFVKDLEIYCGSQQHCRELLIRMNLLGLFQSHNEIARLQSVRHLENMVFLYSDEHIVSSSVGHIPDPFGSQSIFSLKAWPVSEFAMEPMASSKSSFTHHDLRKVSDIATGNFESNIKAAAIEQLLTMMSSDHKLLVTADINWLISTCSSVIASFETILFGDSDINMVPPTDLAYLLGGAKFLAFTICRSAVLRDRVVFKAAKGSSVSFLPVLKVLILGCTSKSMLELAAEGSNVIQEFCTICAQMMQILATNTESFSKDFQSLTKSFASLTVSVSWMRRGRNETPLKVCPTINVYDYLMTDNFVSAKLLDADSFSLESIENTAEFETTAYMLTVARPVIDVSSDSDTLQEFLSSAGELVSVESIQLLLTTDSFPSQDRIHIATTAKLFQAISSARNHQILRDNMGVTIALSNVYLPLYHSFLSLNITPMVAVSHIVTTAPSTRKDYVTLAHTLEFLFEICKKLSSEFDMTPEISAFLMDTTQAILPALTIFVRDQCHGGVYLNSSHMGITDGHNFTSTEAKKELLSSIRSVEYTYYKLLLVLSSFGSFCEHHKCFSGNYLAYHLLLLTSNELVPAAVRGLAVSTVGNLLETEDGYRIFRKPTNVEYNDYYDTHNNRNKLLSKLLSMESNEVSDTSEPPECLILHYLVRTIKTLRIPDSMMGSSALTGSLQCLHTFITQITYEGAQPEGDIVAKMDWKWLTKFLYDRRADVKVLSLEIIAMVLSFRNEEYHTSESFVDSLVDPVDHDDLSASIAWPPVQQLQHLIMDSSESGKLRAVAVSILVDLYVRQTSRAHRDARADDVSVSVILTGISESFQLRDNFSSSATALAMMNNLQKLMNCCQEEEFDTNTNQNAMIFQLLRAAKVIPLAVEFMSVETSVVMFRRACSRTGVASAASSDLFDTSVRGNKAWSSVVMQSFKGGWRAAMMSYYLSTRTTLDSTSSILVSALLSIKKCHREFFFQCLKHSNLLSYLANRLVSQSEDYEGEIQETPLITLVNQQAYSDHLRLFCSILSNDVLTTEKCTLSGESCSEMVTKAFVTNHQLFPQQLFEKILTYLSTISHNNDELLIDQSLGIHYSVFTIAEFIALDHCRALIGLGGPYEGCQMERTPARLFVCLLTLRKRLKRISTSSNRTNLCQLLLEVDVVLSLFLQNSFSAKEMFLLYGDYEPIVSEIKNTTKVSEPSSVIVELISIVQSSTEYLLIKKPRELSKAADASMKSSLTKIKSAAKGTTASKKPATLGSASSKWREKARSYSWKTENLDKENIVNRTSVDTTSSKVSTKATDELSIDMRRYLWSALLLLGSLLPNNQMALEVAVKMNLHHSVNALLKFAGRWSLAATVHLPETFTGPQSFFSPTNGQIAVAIFTLCCSLTYNSKYAKQLLSASGENAATVLKSFGSSYQSSGNTLHQLISIGISSGMVNETNWLCIQYVGSLLSHSNIGSPTMKTTLAHVIALALQRCQHVNNPNFNNHRINNMNVLFLLNALTSYLSAEGLNGYNQLYDKDVKNSINLVQAKQMARDFLSLPNENLNEDMRLMSLPELLKWIVDNNQHSNQDPIKVAICKCLGNLYDNCSDDASVVQHRKTISSPAASEDMLAILIDAKCTDTDATNGNGGSNLFIKAIAAVALWNLLHQSEKAKSIAKELTNSIQSNKFGNPKSPIDTNYVATNTNCSEVEEILVKAETMINLLIQ